MSAASLLLLVAVTQAPAPHFEPVQPDLLKTGASFVNAWADYDNDSDLDLFVGFGGEANRLYRNDGGVLVDVAAALGVGEARSTRAAAWGDFDGDGDADLIVGFTPGPGGVLRLYRNFAGKFVDASDVLSAKSDSGAVRQLVWVDFDGDDDLDLFVGMRDRPNMMFRNDRGRLTNVAAEIGLADTRKTVGAVWLDYDEDGDLDVYVGNMDGDANGLFRNDAGKFTDVAEAAGVAWGGRTARDPMNGTVRPCAADVDGDGHLDLFAANYGKNGLFLNKGAGKFQDVSAEWGVAVDGRYDSCAFSDFDHDGRIDLYVNGTVTGGTSYPDYLLRNTGMKFEDVTPANIKALQADHGVQWADFDRDGDEDLALTGSRPDGMHLILRNMLPADVARRSVRVRVISDQGRATRAGAEVRVFAKGTQRLLGMRLVDAGSGYNSQNEMQVQIPVAQAQPVDIEVTFPRAGKRVVSRLLNVDPKEWQGAVLTVRVPGP
jgi:hypothetical protein